MFKNNSEAVKGSDLFSNSEDNDAAKIEFFPPPPSSTGSFPPDVIAILDFDLCNISKGDLLILSFLRFNPLVNKPEKQESATTRILLALISLNFLTIVLFDTQSMSSSFSASIVSQYPSSDFCLP